MKIERKKAEKNREPRFSGAEIKRAVKDFEGRAEGRMSKSSLYNRILYVSYAILDIVEEILEIGGIAADPFLADLNCYCCNKKEKEEIGRKIKKRFSLSSKEHNYFKMLLNYPIALMALYLLCRREERKAK